MLLTTFNFIFPFYYVHLEMKKLRFREVRHVPQNIREEAAEPEIETKSTWQKTSMSFPLYKAAISIGVYVRRKSKYHSSPSHTKHSKTGTKNPQNIQQ